MAKRKGLGAKTRFEVFKRDSFKCQYCGRCAPEVILQADHIHPVSKGGEDDILNLITSCAECNGGKGARELSDDAAIVKQRAQLEELSERRDQLEMMLKWREGLREIDDATVDAIASRYEALMPGWELNDLGRASVEKMLKKFTVTEVLDALEKSARQYVKIKDGTATRESVDLAWHRVTGIALLDRQPDSIRELYYVRGIMRKRFSYCPEWKAIKLLKEAHAAGADPQELKDLAKDCTCWTQFTCAVEREWGVKE